MDNVIEKAKNLITVIDESDLMRKIEHYQKKILDNEKIMSLIHKYNSSADDYEKRSVKEEIYGFQDYTLYMKYYNELFYKILKINYGFKKYTGLKGC